MTDLALAEADARALEALRRKNSIIRRLLRDIPATLALGFLVLILLGAVLAPWIVPHDPFASSMPLFDSTVAWGKLATQEFDAFRMSFPYVSRRCAEPLFPLGQHADAEPHELEGPGNRQAAGGRLDRAVG